MSPPSLKLVSHPLCPFVQRAAIVLLEKGMAFERVQVDLAAKPEWFLTLSPIGKVPLLQVRLPGGPEVVLFESTAICEYLEETQPGAPMFSGDPLARAQQRAWVEFGTAALGDAWQFLNARDAATADAVRAAFRDKLLRLERQLHDGPYFMGPAFCMVDAAFAPVFRYFDALRAPVSRSVFEGLPRVSSWRAALADRPSVVSAVADDYADRFQRHLVAQHALLAGALR